MAGCGPHGQGGECDGDDGQPGAEDVQQPHGVLCLAQFVGVEQRDRPVAVGDGGGLVEARVDEALPYLVDDGADVELDRVAGGTQGALLFTGEHVHHRGVRPPVRALPCLPEELAVDDPGDVALHDGVDHGAQRAVQGPGPRHDL